MAEPIVSSLYAASLAQLASESYLQEVNLAERDAYSGRLTNGNNHHADRFRPSLDPSFGTGGSRIARGQIEEFAATFDIIDHLPNQSSGFSATLLKNRLTGEYTLAFRSTEYRNIEYGSDAERDSVRGAAGDIAFNGMAFTQLSSMQKYWSSLLDGSRAQGANPDASSASANVAGLRVAELNAFKTAIASGVKLNVSGYSLGGHLATMFSVFNGDRVRSLYLFNSAGVGTMRADLADGATYRTLLDRYEYFMRPDNRSEALAQARAWVAIADAHPQVALGVRLRGSRIPLARVAFIPGALAGVVSGTDMSAQAIVTRLIQKVEAQASSAPRNGADSLPIAADSALSFLVSLFLSASLEGTYAQTLGRLAGLRFPSLQETGAIPAHVNVYQIAGVPAEGLPSVVKFRNLSEATDWNIVADSGVRAARDANLVSVYIENQPTAAGIPFFDASWAGDFGTTHSITLIVDSLAVTRMLQLADANLTQTQAEQIMRAASNLRKQHYTFFRANALAEHDTLERVVDAFGRLLFARRTVDGIDWSQDLLSADGVASYGQLVYRDPLHDRIQAIEHALGQSDLAGRLTIQSLATRSSESLRAAAAADGEPGLAVRYALLELNPFVATGAAGLYEGYGRADALRLYDPTEGTGRITPEWIRDRSDFLALRMQTGMADHYYAAGDESVLYASANGERALVFSGVQADAILPPSAPVGPGQRKEFGARLELLASDGRARKVLFGAEGDPAQNPGTRAGGADRLRGGTLADRLYGEGGNDYIEGLAGDDHIEGGPGDDSLIGGPGSDVLVGGVGEDRYVWSRGDGNDRIVDVREADGLFHGRIVLKTITAELTPWLFKRGDADPVDVWRTPDRRFTLTRRTTWMLGFDGGEVDLGPDIRSGDFGFKIDGPQPVPGATIIQGIVQDQTFIGPNRAGLLLEGDYGHDKLYGSAAVSLDTFLVAAHAPGVPGWGIWIAAGPGEDLALGTTRDDVLEGGGGKDVLAGGPGNDTISGDSDFSPLESDPARWVYVTQPDHVYDKFVGPAIRVTNRLSVYPEQWLEAGDEIYGGGGADQVYGHGGDDLLYGDAGNDVVFGGEGNDYVLGGEDADVLIGESFGYARVASEVVNGVVRMYSAYVASYGNDVMDGGAGNDLLVGDGGNDVLSGGEGADELHGDYQGSLNALPGALHGDDILNGGAGDDVIDGEGGADIAFGGDGNDYLVGDSGVEGAYHKADLLYGEAGNDQLHGGGDADVLVGGEGADTLIGDALELASAWHGNDALDGGAGNDVMIGLGGRDELFGGDGDDFGYGDHPDNATSGEADYLDGGNGKDRLWGQGGNDILLGGAEADTLFGDAGDDTLDGGPGDDFLNGGPGDDIYVYRPGDGVDRIEDASGITTIAFAEGVELASIHAARVQQGNGPQPLQIEYGEGDRIVLDPLVTLQALRIRIGESDVMGGAELQSLGQPRGTAVPGSEGSEFLIADIGTASDLFGFTGDDLLHGSDLNDRLDGGSGHDEIHGLGGDDLLLGGADADRLLGGTGNDRLEGGLGDDTYEFVADEGSEVVVERAGQGYDAIRWRDPMASEAVRLRRVGDHLVLAERATSGRIRVLDWFASPSPDDRGIDAIEFDGLTLDASSIAERVTSDRTLRGTQGADRIVGDEFDDVLIGGAGDDLLAGLQGDDRYVYGLGDGSDRLQESDGYDVLAFGAGIDPGVLDIKGERDAGGALDIVLTVAGDGGAVRFGERREQRIEGFEFEGGVFVSYTELLQRAGGVRQQGGDEDDVIDGGTYADAMYGFGGDDTLRSGMGRDFLAGGGGDDLLAGGAHDDTYRFGLGDGRDSIVEFAGSDEYGIYDAYFMADGVRAYEVEGVVFRQSDVLYGPMSETYNIGLGALHGGEDTLEFAEGIAPADLRWVLDLGLPGRPYLVGQPNASGGITPVVEQAAQLGFILEVGASGDAVEIVAPTMSGWPLDPATALDRATVESVRFDDDPQTTWTLRDLYSTASGWHAIRGSAAPDEFSGEQVLSGGWIAGGAGDDRYVQALGFGVTLIELPDEGEDTVVVDAPLVRDSAVLTFDQHRLQIDTPGGRLVLGDFAADRAAQAMIERFEAPDGSFVSGLDLLAVGVDVPGTPIAEVLSGTSVEDRIEAGAGADVVFAREGNDVLLGGPGGDHLFGGPGSDRYRYARGDGADRIEEGEGPGDIDTLVLEAGILPAAVRVERAGDDLVLAFDGGADAVAIGDWFATGVIRIESIEFGEGTRWDAAALAALTAPLFGTTPAPVPEPETRGPNEPPAVVDPVPPPVSDSAPQTTDATTAPPSSGSTAGAPTVVSEGSGPVPVAESAPAVAAVPAAEPLAVIDPPSLSAAVAQARSAASGNEPVGELAGAAASPVASEPGVAAGGVFSAPSALETLAAGGFVSPGRSTSSVTDETLPMSETDRERSAEQEPEPPATPAGDAMARYWQWMHARLDEHLATASVDDVESAGLMPRMPLDIHLGDEAVRLAPLRTIGVAGSSGFVARAFEGLREGLMRLG